MRIKNASEIYWSEYKVLFASMRMSSRCKTTNKGIFFVDAKKIAKLSLRQQYAKGVIIHGDNPRPRKQVEKRNSAPRDLLKSNFKSRSPARPLAKEVNVAA